MSFTLPLSAKIVKGGSTTITTNVFSNIVPMGAFDIRNFPIHSLVLQQNIVLGGLTEAELTIFDAFFTNVNYTNWFYYQLLEESTPRKWIITLDTYTLNIISWNPKTFKISFRIEEFFTSLT
ncbi:MAG: hypothetical protein ACREVA_01210 [Burkholderiales bacterium]